MRGAIAIASFWASIQVCIIPERALISPFCLHNKGLQWAKQYLLSITDLCQGRRTEAHSALHACRRHAFTSSCVRRCEGVEQSLPMTVALSHAFDSHAIIIKVRVCCLHAVWGPES